MLIELLLDCSVPSEHLLSNAYDAPAADELLGLSFFVDSFSCS
jgi:hypothetical protein